MTENQTGKIQQVADLSIELRAKRNSNLRALAYTGLVIGAIFIFLGLWNYSDAETATNSLWSQKSRIREHESRIELMARNQLIEEGVIVPVEYESAYQAGYKAWQQQQSNSGHLPSAPPMSNVEMLEQFLKQSHTLPSAPPPQSPQAETDIFKLANQIASKAGKLPDVEEPKPVIPEKPQFIKDLRTRDRDIEPEGGPLSDRTISMMEQAMRSFQPTSSVVSGITLDERSQLEIRTEELKLSDIEYKSAKFRYAKTQATAHSKAEVAEGAFFIGTILILPALIIFLVAAARSTKRGVQTAGRAIGKAGEAAAVKTIRSARSKVRDIWEESDPSRKDTESSDQSLEQTDPDE